MSIYRFAATSPVREIVFRHANDRPPIALISAGNRVNANQLSVIRRMLEAEGMQCVPAAEQGKSVLQVDGFKEEGQLAALLALRDFAIGNPLVQPEAGDHPSRSFKEWLEDTSLKAGGWSNLVGDGALLMSGLMSGRGKEITTGALYTAGGLIVSRYGNVKTEHHLRNVTERLASFLKQQAGMLPEDCGLYTLLKEQRKGALHNTEDFLYKYPSQVTLGIYTLGALAMVQSGLKHKKVWDTAYGVNSVATKVASILVPEKGELNEEELKAKAKQGTIGKIIDWVQEKPLRIFGYGSMISDGLLGMSALREYQANPKQKSYIFKAVTTGTYLLADLMFAVSSKKTDGKFDTEEQRRIEALAAETIAVQPAGVREALINQTAGFLSLQPEMQGNSKDIAEGIREQVTHMEKNPWLCTAHARKMRIESSDVRMH